MVSLNSPGVSVQENDFTTIVPSVTSTPGAIVGAFQWGPVLQRTLVETENKLRSVFQDPNDDVFTYWFSAANFLAYSAALNVVRVVGDLAKNAVGAGSAVIVKNETDYTEGFTPTSEVIVAKYPGKLGNSLGVIYLDHGNYTNAAYDMNGDGIAESVWNQFSTQPNTSTYVSDRNGSNDEMHILVFDRDGSWTGTKGEIIEKFPFVSKAKDAKRSDGTSAYYKDVLNNESQYLWFASHPEDPEQLGDSGANNWGSNAANTAFKTFAVNSMNPGDAVFLLNGGVDDNGTAAITDGKLEAGADLFIDPDSVDVGLFITGPGDAVYVNYVNDNIATIRKDCVVFATPPRTAVVNNAGSETDDSVTWRNTLTDSTYLFLDSAWKYQYDRYNDVYRYIPLNGDTAGLAARTDLTNDPWFSPAGYTRGIYKNIVRLSWQPTLAQRDTLYNASINPVITKNGLGTVLFGDKTATGKPSAFDRINVRRLFISIEKSIAIAAKFTLFEINDDFTRAQFKGIVDPFLRDVLGRRGVTDYKVVCDTSNNTPQIIDSNQFVADIFVKPSRSINFILLRFTSVATGVSFEEVGG